MLHVLASMLCGRIVRYVAAAVEAITLDISNTVPSTLSQRHEGDGASLDVLQGRGAKIRRHTTFCKGS
jgi:hypothetical protein